MMRAFVLSLIFCLVILFCASKVCSQTIPFIPRPADATDCPSLPPPPTANLEAISCFMPRPNTEVWSIFRPNVRQFETGYPPIRFVQGDLVTLAAGGCVQTGGSGLTWKRYVDPMTLTRGSDGQYFGSLYIPGVVGPVAFRDQLKGGPLSVTSDPGPDAYLRLRYKDDGYGDNGYWGRENGLLEQCRRMPEAWVAVIIQHNCAGNASGDCITNSPVDLTADAWDDNGFARGPKLAWERLTRTPTPAWQICGLNYKSVGMPEDDLSLCTRDNIYKDTSVGLCPSAPGESGTWGRIAGHANWNMGVTYEGRVWWSSYSADQDYNFILADDANSFFTEGSNLEIEFDSRETIDSFNTNWWKDFRSAVDSGNGSNYIYGQNAIVIGKPGLDCVHACKSEIHPLWAIAIHVKDDPKDDVWAFFVRNWGNEGYCGRGDHKVTTPSIAFRLKRPGAVDVHVLSQEVEMNLSFQQPQIAIVQGGGAALLNFPLPDPSQHGMYNGIIHLKWDRAPAIVTKVPQRPPLQIITRYWPKECESGNSEELMNDIVQYMTPQQKQAYRQAIRIEEKVPQYPVNIKKVDEISIRGQIPKINVDIDPKLEARRRREMDSLRKIMGDEFPEEIVQQQATKKVEIRLFNGDDVSYAYVNGTELLKATYSQDTDWIDISPYMKNGSNAIRFKQYNDRSGWTYGFQIRENGRETFNKACGKVGSVGCQHNNQTVGDVYDETIYVTYP